MSVVRLYRKALNREYADSVVYILYSKIETVVYSQSDKEIKIYYYNIDYPTHIDKNDLAEIDNKMVKLSDPNNMKTLYELLKTKLRDYHNEI